ncbi:GIY-YIG nuclease family protein [Candidatus Gottesmanbacteria bacterium]|nr:GIY-YIG nuclease family protein [Candidatus Gottesmanbacteria bacterium]
MFYVYILRSKVDNKLYSGYTNDLRRRFMEHNKGVVASTRYRKPFALIYYEAYLEQRDATSREKFFKTQWGRNYLRKVLKNYWTCSSVG